MISQVLHEKLRNSTPYLARNTRVLFLAGLDGGGGVTYAWYESSIVMGMVVASLTCVPVSLTLSMRP